MAFAEIKLFKNKKFNNFLYSVDASQRYNSRIMDGIEYVYQFEFYSQNLKVENPNPSVHLFIRDKTFYDEIKKLAN